MSRTWNPIHRSDSTSEALVAEAKALGAMYLPINGAIDGVLFYKNRAWVVDFKGPKTKLTKRQSKMLADGFPIWFIRTSDELRKMLEIS